MPICPQGPWTLLPGVRATSCHFSLSLRSQPARAGFPIINASHPRALTGPQAQGHLLGCHLNDVRARRTGALAAERQASQDPGAAGRALKLASAAVSDQVCLQVTPGGDWAQAAEVLRAGTEEESTRRSGCLSGAPLAALEPSTLHFRHLKVVKVMA